MANALRTSATLAMALVICSQLLSACFSFVSFCSLCSHGPRNIQHSGQYGKGGFRANSLLRPRLTSHPMNSKGFIDDVSDCFLKRVRVKDVRAEAIEPVDPLIRDRAREIVESIKERGVDSLLEWAVRLGDLQAQDQDDYWACKEDLQNAYLGLPQKQRAILDRVGGRIRAFAELQRSSLHAVETSIPGGRAGQSVSAVQRAGCYAPGGRYPLPSSVLMTAITARTAGVHTVWVASPRPTHVTLAAAHVAGADGLLKIGGAQAIAAMTFGAGVVPRSDVIVGPGNAWVTAAKAAVQGACKIDMLAGPSEVLVIADHSADPGTVAADLLAQAEHDASARPILVCTDSSTIAAVERELQRRLERLPEPNRETAASAIASNGFAVLAGSVEEAVAVSDAVAPEHLQIMTENAQEVAQLCQHYGGLFVGQYAAEVLGDYGCGPNHVLPTGGTARHSGGLSVHTFLRVRTWMRIDAPGQSQSVVDDAAALARMEGLEAHAQAAEQRFAM